MASSLIEYNELLPLGRIVRYNESECIADTEYKQKKDEEYREFIEELKRQTTPYEV